MRPGDGRVTLTGTGLITGGKQGVYSSCKRAGEPSSLLPVADVGQLCFWGGTHELIKVYRIVHSVCVL